MTNNRITPQFTPDHTKGEAAFGWFWLMVHMFVLPLLFAVILPEADSALTVNYLYYGVSMAVVLLVFLRMLRREFDHLLDRFLHCIASFFAAYFFWYSLSLIMAGIMGALGITATPPNDQAVDTLAKENFGGVLAISVIFAPIVEEVLFRGVLFQSIRRHSRVWAYIASLAVFGIYHTWQFAVVYQDPVYLLYSLQYIPITFALTWSYEKSGSLWVPIFFHASNNYLAMQIAQMM
ncbi:MAG: CPBP family intramembrane metalloprotease [Oscillospiraceae bacterium]|nr:CPBP family intramembrane metalloprotease [Oscillospiraceae bacterium]